ncbi:polysaccharide pyruvyl transferase family protein [Rhodococcus sp. SGAir0479]|uniref:polysaccharide pyruvyl transferase family protein n=1 Tax=Rhodococcus sp. SGAir0479 TaxID=2567884 RepID=UPI0010CCD3A9|nr:polysaccharide pyruvyl transferase family protein [Rhodococcus sp. SGAir0479]QCQ92560.1 polysaccharide pyruvyl transferase family protein [Rhodococcus sp. SGAir0479]
MKVLILHGYSSLNAGDGLLVEHTIDMLREAFDDTAEISLVASRPETFADLPLRIYNSAPGIRGYSKSYLRLLRRMAEFDLIVGVGGGYLRAGRPVELAKTLIVHGPQLIAASLSDAPTVYLPQSIGPARYGSRRAAAALLGRINTVYGRDDRTISEFQGVGISRAPDLALLAPEHPQFARGLPDPVPVLSVRALNGAVPPLVAELAEYLGEFDGYIQSAVGGNDDTEAMTRLGPGKIIPRDELLNPTQPRVVVAVRLHAALMAMQAGHYVIHLAYERKGFGAFQDLDLSDFVHNVNKFEPERVMQQISALSSDNHARADYERRVLAARSDAKVERQRIVESLRSAARAG